MQRLNKPQTRAAFLARTGLGLLGATLLPTRALPAAPQNKKDSKLKRWDIITIGNLSRNRYWGESDAKGVRAAICTCTVIQGEGFRLLVDPSLSKADEMAKELDRRTGLKLSDIDSIFITHEHADHFAGLTHFPAARWCAGPEAATALNKTQKLSLASHKGQNASVNPRFTEGIQGASAAAL